MVVIKPVVHKSGDDALAGVAHLPDRGDVHHVFREVVVHEMPLVFELWVDNAFTLCNGA